MNKKIKFLSPYLLADHVSDTINDPLCTEWGDDFFDISKQIHKFIQPSRISILHEFITSEFSRLYNKFATSSCSKYTEIWEDYLKYNSVKHLQYEEFVINKRKDLKKSFDETKDDVDYFNLYSLALMESSRNHAYTHVIDRTFAVLFSDRQLLRSFNRILGEVISKLSINDYPNFLSENGILKTFNSYPSWVTKAIIYRDNGCCSICAKDISTSPFYAIDYLIPLELGGTHDIINLQLVCKDCSLSNPSKNGVF